MIHIRPATSADVPLMLEFIHELAEFEREPHSVKMTEDQLLEDGFGTDPQYECVIAECDGSRAGWALFFPIYSTWRGRGLHLEGLFVRPQFRGRSIGKALLRRVAAIAAERGCTKLQWEVLDWNQPAIDFYHAIGAFMLNEWRIMRVTGDALAALAASGTEGKV